MLGNSAGGIVREFTKPVRCVVVPNRPPIDRYIAYKRVQLDHGPWVNLKVAFCDVNIPTPTHLAKWQALCSPGQEPILIDVGDEKYHKGFLSAAHMQDMASGTEGSSTWNWLVGLANENNETGALKQRRHSVAKMIREIYHVTNETQESLFYRCLDVVDSFFWKQNKRPWDDVFSNPVYSKLKNLWEGFSVTENEVLPFTLPMYFRKLFMSGRAESDIIGKIRWWIDMKKRVDDRHAAARAKQYQPDLYMLGRRKVGVVRISDYFESLAFSFSWVGSGKLAMAIIRDKEGRVTIVQSFRHKPADLEPLAWELERREPTRWYHETRFKAGHMIMNGSWQFTGVPPTALSDVRLLDVICRCYGIECSKIYPANLVQAQPARS